ncbi:hypothetical protein D3C83_133520 [compost metagenome]
MGLAAVLPDVEEFLVASVQHQGGHLELSHLLDRVVLKKAGQVRRAREWRVGIDTLRNRRHRAPGDLYRALPGMRTQRALQHRGE